jgi:hypothetical protein
MRSNIQVRKTITVPMAVEEGISRIHRRIVPLVFVLAFTWSSVLSARLPASPQEANLGTQEVTPQASSAAPKSHRTQTQKISIAGTAFSISPDDAAQHRVKIIEPDGSVAKRISILSLPPDVRAKVDLQSMEKESSFRVEELGSDGILVLDLSKPEQFFYLETDMGCLLLAGSRILATNQLDLLAWSKVRVKISHRDKPLANTKVTYNTALTSLLPTIQASLSLLKSQPVNPVSKSIRSLRSSMAKSGSG